MSSLKLGVNIDHIATLRQARYSSMPESPQAEPNLIMAAGICERAGAQGITVHLRADRRHIQDRDVTRLRQSLNTKLNLEMGNTLEILEIALRILPEDVCLVPENRREITTEGGLDAAAPDAEGFHGARITLAAPDMPPMGLSMERLTSGTKTRRYRTTANTVFHVAEGAGETTVGDKRFFWQRGDTFVAPGWHAISHQATSDAQLFVLADEPLLRFANYYRFEAVE